MGKKKLLILMIVVIIIGVLIAFLNEQPDKQRTRVDSNEIKVPTARDSDQSESIEIQIPQKIETKKRVVINANELLDMFSFPPPPMNEENQDKYQNLLSELNSNPQETLNYFTELIKESADDDAKRSLIVNFVNKLDLTKREKSDFFSSYIESVELKTDGKVLHDQSLSALLAVDFLSQNISLEEAPEFIENALDGRSQIEKENLLDRFAIYFPELTEEYR